MSPEEVEEEQEHKWSKDRKVMSRYKLKPQLIEGRVLQIHLTYQLRNRWKVSTAFYGGYRVE